MRVPVLEAADQLDELIDRAAAGEDIVLTVDGRDAVRLVATARLRRDAERPQFEPPNL